MDAKADDRAGPGAAPEAHPKRTVEPEKDRCVLRRKAADAARPGTARQEGDIQAEARRNATVAAQPGGRFLDKPPPDQM